MRPAPIPSWCKNLSVDMVRTLSTQIALNSPGHWKQPPLLWKVCCVSQDYAKTSGKVDVFQGNDHLPLSSIFLLPVNRLCLSITCSKDKTANRVKRSCTQVQGPLLAVNWDLLLFQHAEFNTLAKCLENESDTYIC